MLKRLKQLKSLLKSSTARDFSGGLNVVDSELNLNSKFARIQDNMYRGLDGSITIRQGCKLFADLQALSAYSLINATYFRGFIVAINAIGEVFTVDGAGNMSRVWDATIAAARRFGLKIWSPTTFVTFIEFAGELTMHNGVDKPLLMTKQYIVDYLADPVTNSNINTPIGSVVAKFNKQMVIANGTLLNVSDNNTCKAWFNDPSVTYAAIFDMSSSVDQGDPTIIGLSSFRNYLLVHFAESTVPVQFTQQTTPSVVLNISNASDFGGSLQGFGALSARTNVNIGKENLACDIVGVQSVALQSFTQILSPSRPSRLVDPLIKAAIAKLDATTLNNSVFAVWDRLASMYMLFLPDTAVKYQRETRGFGYRYIDDLNVQAWNTFSGWNWAWSTRSAEGYIFFGRANSTQVFIKGDDQKLPLYADFIGDQEVFSDGTTFTDQTGWYTTTSASPVSDINTSGVPIKFQWDIPWSDMRDRATSKKMKYLKIDSQGSAQFTVSVFIDNKYNDMVDEGELFTDGTDFYDNTGFLRDQLTNPALIPNIQMNYVGGDYPGYGQAPYGDIYGGGVSTAFERLLEAPTQYDIFKMRFSGETMAPLKIVAITPLYIKGSVRRQSDE